jgi:hypothetical protein
MDCKSIKLYKERVNACFNANNKVSGMRLLTVLITTFREREISVSEYEELE